MLWIEFKVKWVEGMSLYCRTAPRKNNIDGKAHTPTTWSGKKTEKKNNKNKNNDKVKQQQKH